MQPCRGCDPGSNPGRGATNSPLAISGLLLRILVLVKVLEPCVIGVCDSDLSCEKQGHYNPQ